MQNAKCGIEQGRWWIKLALAGVAWGAMVQGVALGAEEEDFSARAAKPTARAAAGMSLEEAFAALPAYKFGQSRLCCSVIENAVFASVGRPERAGIAQRLIAVLETPGTTDDAKTFILWQLRTIGSDAAVPALAKLLGHEKHSHMARAALRMTGTPAADAAMRQALQTLSGEALAGLCISIGDRRDRQAVSALTKLLAGGDERIRIAAAAAMGRIADNASAAALMEARNSATPAIRTAILDAALACAERMISDGDAAGGIALYQRIFSSDEAAPVRLAALRGLARGNAPDAVRLVTEALRSADPAWRSAAAQCVGEMTAPQAAAAFVGALPGLDPRTQAQVLRGLAMREARSALPIALDLAASDDPALRVAAIEAVGQLGDASVLPTLLQAASSRGAAQETARSALDRLRGAEVSPAMIRMLDTAPPAGKVELVRTLAARGAEEALPAMLKAAADGNAAVRVQAFRSLEELATAKEAPALVALLAGVKDGTERTAAENAIVAACRRLGEGDLASAPTVAAYADAGVETRGSLLRILARLQGPRAMQTLRAAVKDANTEISDTAIRAMTSANDQALAGDLLALAQDAPRANQKILALRGYIALASDRSVRDADKVNRLAAAMPVATRPDEKRLVLAAMGNISTADALRAIEPHLADGDLAQSACVAAINSARSMKGNDALVRQVMTRVAAVAADEKLKKEAQSIAARAGGN